MTAKLEAFQQYLKTQGFEPEEIENDVRVVGGTGGRNDTYEFQGGEWMVLTDSEADAQAAVAITDSLWAFKLEFLAAHSRIIRNMGAPTRKLFDSMRENACESSNDLVEILIDDLDALILDAIMMDGRGHFLATYDGDEPEVMFKGHWYFIYRIG